MIWTSSSHKTKSNLDICILRNERARSIVLFMDIFNLFCNILCWEVASYDAASGTRVRGRHSLPGPHGPVLLLSFWRHDWDIRDTATIRAQLDRWADLVSFSSVLSLALSFDVLKFAKIWVVWQLANGSIIHHATNWTVSFLSIMRIYSRMQRVDNEPKRQFN